MTEEETLPAQGHSQAHGGRGGLKGRPRGRLRGRLSVSAPGQRVCPARFARKSWLFAPCSRRAEAPRHSKHHAPTFKDASPAAAAQLPTTVSSLSLQPPRSWALPMAPPPSPPPLELTSGPLLSQHPGFHPCWPLVFHSPSRSPPSIPVNQDPCAAATLFYPPPGWPPCCSCLTP